MWTSRVVVALEKDPDQSLNTPAAFTTTSKLCFMESVVGETKNGLGVSHKLGKSVEQASRGMVVVGSYPRLGVSFFNDVDGGFRGEHEVHTQGVLNMMTGKNKVVGLKKLNARGADISSQTVENIKQKIDANQGECFLMIAAFDSLEDSGDKLLTSVHDEALKSEYEDIKNACDTVMREKKTNAAIETRKTFLKKMMGSLKNIPFFKSGKKDLKTITKKMKDLLNKFELNATQREKLDADLIEAVNKSAEANGVSIAEQHPDRVQKYV